MIDVMPRANVSPVTRLRLWLISRSRLTEFEKKVLRHVALLEAGSPITYGELAAKTGRPNSGRAVGNALNRNPFPVIIPCHRVVGSSGIGGYKYGVLAKKLLLGMEKLVR